MLESSPTAQSVTHTAAVVILEETNTDVSGLGYSQCSSSNTLMAESSDLCAALSAISHPDQM